MSVKMDSRSRTGLHVLEHGVAVQAEFILDHSVSNVSWHLFLRHLVCRKILRGEARAIDTGREVIVVWDPKLDVFKTWDGRLSSRRSLDRVGGGSGHTVEMNHDCYLDR